MKVFILSIFLLLFKGCDEQTPIYLSIEHKNLDENKKLWEKSNIRDYSFVVKKSCFCPHEENKHITVSQNTITQAKYIPSNTILDANMSHKVIDAYFAIIEDALANNAYKLTVNYDKNYGYPTYIDVDYHQNIVDEEESYTLSHFQQGKTGSVCTEQYQPVCASVDIQCITLPCQTVEETFSNTCYLNANPNARFLKDGEC